MMHECLNISPIECYVPNTFYKRKALYEWRIKITAIIQTGGRRRRKKEKNKRRKKEEKREKEKRVPMFPLALAHIHLLGDGAWVRKFPPREFLRLRKADVVPVFDVLFCKVTHERFPALFAVIVGDQMLGVWTAVGRGPVLRNLSLIPRFIFRPIYFHLLSHDVVRACFADGVDPETGDGEILCFQLAFLHFPQRYKNKKIKK
jgi:hypothetical protein